MDQSIGAEQPPQPFASDTEKVVAQLWAEVLDRSRPLEPHDNFFEAGGDSLAMMMMLFRVNEAWGVQVTPVTLIDAPTLGEFCAVVHASRQGLTSPHSE